MANMSYCRFENTSSDLADCLNAIEEAIEEGKSVDEFMAGLSSDHERSGFRHLVRDCRKFIETYEELGVFDSKLVV